MSYSLFRAQINALTGMQHVSRIQFAQTIANAYNGLVERSFETLTAGGIVVGAVAGLPGLTAGIYSITEKNLHQTKEVNFFTQIAPFIYQYWVGKTIVGPTGVVTITTTGNFKGPMIKQNFTFQIWITTFVAVVAVHIMSLQGMYVNNTTGLTSPWSGALLITTP